MNIWLVLRRLEPTDWARWIGVWAWECSLGLGMASAIYGLLVGLRLIGLPPLLALVGLGLGGGLWGWRLQHAHLHMMPSLRFHRGWLGGALATLPSIGVGSLLAEFPLVSTTLAMASFMGLLAFVQSIGWASHPNRRRNWLIFHLVGGGLFGMIAPLGQGFALLGSYAVALVCHALVIGIALLHLQE